MVKIYSLRTAYMGFSVTAFIGILKILTNFSFTKALQGIFYYHLHFTDEETETKEVK
jgi:hypothetical protein